MNNTNIALKFADGGTSGRGSNMFIEGDTIYSYGYHFPIARKTDKQYKQLPVVLFNERGYSNSTAKHKNHVICALMSKYYLLVIDLNNNSPSFWIEDLNYQLNKAIAKRSKARSEHMKEFWNEQVAVLAERINVIKKLFIQL